MRKCIQLISILFFLANPIDSMSQVEVTLNKVGTSIRQSANMGFVPLFVVSNSVVQSPLDMAAADIEDEVKDYQIRLPINNQKGWLYGWLFQEHENADYIPNNILFITKKEKIITSEGPAKLVILDRNYDLDLTNDKVDTIWDKNPSNIIQYFTDSFNSTGFTIENFPHNRFWKFSKMIDLFITESKGKRVFVGSKFSYKVKRYQIRYSNLNFGNEELVLGVFDKNNNGRIDDKGIDEVFISDKIKNINIFDLRSSVRFDRQMELTWLGNAYLVKYQTEKKSFTVSSTHSKCSEFTLMIGQKLPRLRYCVAQKNGGRESLRKINKRSFKLILVWSAFDSTFTQDSALWHQEVRSSKKRNVKIEWIFLNYGGAAKYLSRYNRTYDLPDNCRHGVLSPFEVEKLKLQVMPQWFLVNEHNQILKIGKGFNDLLENQMILN